MVFAVLLYSPFRGGGPSLRALSPLGGCEDFPCGLLRPETSCNSPREGRGLFSCGWFALSREGGTSLYTAPQCWASPRGFSLYWLQ